MAMTTTTTITTKSNANANAKSESAREEKNREKNHYYCMTKVTKTDTIRCIASENRRCRNSFIQTHTHTHNFRLFMLHFLFRILWRSLVSFPFTSFVFNCCFIYTLCTLSLSLSLASISCAQLFCSVFRVFPLLLLCRCRCCRRRRYCYIIWCCPFYYHLFNMYNCYSVARSHINTLCVCVCICECACVYAHKNHLNHKIYDFCILSRASVPFRFIPLNLSYVCWFVRSFVRTYDVVVGAVVFHGFQQCSADIFLFLFSVSFFDH